MECCWSYVGDAICDGGPLEWEFRKPYDSFSNEQHARISIEQLEESEVNHMKYNAFKARDEVTDRVKG